MATFRSIAGSGYGSTYLDALIAGGAVWNTQTGPLSFGFGHQYMRSEWLKKHGAPKEDDGEPYLIPGELYDTWWTFSWGGEKAAPILLALAQVEQVTQLAFDIDTNLDTNHVSDANLVVFTTDLDNWPGGGIWAAAETPQERSLINSNKSWLYVNSLDDGAWEVPHAGGMGFSMLLNMLGTALGLSQAYHEFPGVADAYDPGPNGLNQAPFTVMTANWSYQGTGHPAGEWGSMKSFGAFDIAALQKIYGANTTTAAGNDVYELPTYNSWNGAWGIGRATGWTCIWDSGGNDTISGASAKESVTIDLRAATLIDGDQNAGGFLSQQIGVAGGFTIANGAVIENATGGSGSDTLIGNDAANKLVGGSGNDTLRGEIGADRLYGGAGKDTLTGGAGKDIFVFDTKPNKKTNLDKIVDFNVKDDTIWLENKVFTKLGKSGSEKKPAALKKDFFTLGSKAKDKNDYIVYDNKKGVLYYDADGSGKGKAVEIATLSKKLKMTHKDFFVI